MNFDEFIHNFLKNNMFDQANGLKLEVISPGKIIYKLKVLPIHVSFSNLCHGGILAGLMDSTLGLAALTAAFPDGRFCSTVEFKINYLNPAYLEDELEGIGNIDFKGKRLIVTTASIENITQKNLTAKGLGTFNTYPMQKKK
ncbi:MAG: PaaI family thioesterase [Bacteriovoracaceae bacterium]